jgi:hypothetical protein
VHAATGAGGNAVRVVQWELVGIKRSTFSLFRAKKAFSRRVFSAFRTTQTSIKLENSKSAPIFEIVIVFPAKLT